MNTEQLELLNQQQRIKAVNFVESGCGPMVVEVEYTDSDELMRDLIKDNNGNVITCKNIKDGYQICLSVGIHNANLVQIVTDEETSQSDFADYHRESVPLVF